MGYKWKGKWSTNVRCLATVAKSMKLQSSEMWKDPGTGSWKEKIRNSTSDMLNEIFLLEIPVEIPRSHLYMQPGVQKTNVVGFINLIGIRTKVVFWAMKQDDIINEINGEKKWKDWWLKPVAFQNSKGRASLVAQWLRICLPMQGTRVRALVWEDPTRHGATRPMSHNYWACASGACAPQQERPR